ncbi:MAG: dihydroorotase, partial [Flavitalea sp.]
MQKYLIRNITVVNEGHSKVKDVLIEKGRIEKIEDTINHGTHVQEINGEGKYLLPGVIDDQVHFREPGLTNKGTIYSESKAAIAGGVTSFMEMPNTVPPVFTQELLEEKYAMAARSSLANYSFYMGTSNENMEEALKTNQKKETVCGVKIFMGSSTGGLLVDNYISLDKLFRESELLIATHCEDEKIIRANFERIKKQKTVLEASDHPLIRDENACFESSLAAIQFAKKYDTRLHILHISTEKEIQLFSNMIPLEEKRITAEVCVHHLHFTSFDYDELGNRIKCNPAIKPAFNKHALWNAVLDDRLDVIATDHAPHTLKEKGFQRNGDGSCATDPDTTYEKSHAGLPLVQHSLLLMLHYVKEGTISLEKVVEKMSHAVATCFRVTERGFIREGYHADIVIVDLNRKTTVQW